jgi:osmotically-inducible protein OsmY
MEVNMRKLGLTVALLGLMNLVSGCAPLVIGAGAEGAVLVAQERTVGDAVDDAGILIGIKHKFSQKDVNDLLGNVEVKVVEGRVLLTGNVEKPETQVEAVNLAWQIEGVKEVINEIQINDKSGFGNYAQDVWISTQVRSRLLFTKGIRSVNYSVITVNQVVYLMGVAQDQSELDKATYVASTTAKVQKVVSYVRMKSDPRRPVNLSGLYFPQRTSVARTSAIEARSPAALERIPAIRRGHSIS